MFTINARTRRVTNYRDEVLGYVFQHVQENGEYVFNAWVFTEHDAMVSISIGARKIDKEWFMPIGSYATLQLALQDLEQWENIFV